MKFSATVVRKDDGNGNILLSRVEAADVLAWDKLKEMKESGEVLDVVVKGITNGRHRLCRRRARLYPGIQACS